MDSKTYGEPMTFDVLDGSGEEGQAAKVRPLNDTFKCPPVCG